MSVLTAVKEAKEEASFHRQRSREIREEIRKLKHRQTVKIAGLEEKIRKALRENKRQEVATLEEKTKKTMEGTKAQIELLERVARTHEKLAREQDLLVALP